MAWPPVTPATWSQHGSDFPETIDRIDTDGTYIYLSNGASNVYRYNPATDTYTQIGSSAELTGVTTIQAIAWYNGGLIVVGDGTYNFDVWRWNGSWSRRYFSNASLGGNPRVRTINNRIIAFVNGQFPSDDGFAVVSEDGIDWGTIPFSDDPQTWRITADVITHWNTHGLAGVNQLAYFGITSSNPSIDTRDYYYDIVDDEMQLIGATGTHECFTGCEVLWATRSGGYAWSDDLVSWNDVSGPRADIMLNYDHSTAYNASGGVGFWDNDAKSWSIVADTRAGVPISSLMLVLNSGQPFVTNWSKLYTRSIWFDPPGGGGGGGNRLWVYKINTRTGEITSRGVGAA